MNVIVNDVCVITEKYQIRVLVENNLHIMDENPCYYDANDELVSISKELFDTKEEAYIEIMRVASLGVRIYHNYTILPIISVSKNKKN